MEPLGVPGQVGETSGMKRTTSGTGGTTNESFSPLIVFRKAEGSPAVPGLCPG